MKVKDLLRKARIGDVIKVLSCKGIVIDGLGISPEMVVDDKALLLTHNQNFLWVELANGLLEQEGKIMGKVRA